MCVFAALALPAAAGASLNMFMGAAEDEGRNADPAVALTKMTLAKAAGFDTIRITAIWEPGQSAVPKGQLDALRSIAAAGDSLGIRLVTTIMPFGSRTTPLTATARTQFARFSADLARHVPSFREYIIGNEPNLNRYWLPQFGPQGEDVAAPAYVKLLAQTYDAMKRVDKGVFLDGGSLAPRGVDVPNTGRDTHSPTAFITDMGIAYRALKRARPIMDGFSFHPYGETSSTPPTVAHPIGRSIGLADYDKLVYLLARRSTARRRPARSCRSSTTSTASTRRFRSRSATSTPAASCRSRFPRECRLPTTSRRSRWRPASRMCADSSSFTSQTRRTTGVGSPASTSPTERPSRAVRSSGRR
jgi:hypothetical protein